MKPTEEEPVYWTRDEQFINDLLGPMLHQIEVRVAATTATVLDNFIKTKGDSISRRQAEREFGKKWLADHIELYGRQIYTQGLWNSETQSLNNRMTFSRKQLAEIRAKETTAESVYFFSRQLFKKQREIEREEKKKRQEMMEELSAANQEGE